MAFRIQGPAARIAVFGVAGYLLVMGIAAAIAHMLWGLVDVLLGGAILTGYFWAIERARGLRIPTVYIKLGPDGYRYRRGFGRAPLLRWNVDMEVTLSPSRQGLYRLSIQRQSPVGTVDWSTALDMLFPCDAARAGEIRAAVHTWRHPVSAA